VKQSPASRSDFITFSDVNNELLTKGGKNGNKDFFFAVIEVFLDVLGDIFKMLLFWEVAVGFDLTLLIKKLKSGVIDVEECVLVSLDDWSINHITGVIGALVDLGGENISSLEDNLGRTMLSWLGSGGFSNLAWVSLNHNQRSVLKSVGISLFAHG